jgi:hypothetical protein
MDVFVPAYATRTMTTNGEKHAYYNPPTILIQDPATSCPLLSIHPDGTVTGEIEDASEAARVFVEHIRKYIAEPQTDALKVAREALERIANRKWDTMTQGCDAASEAAQIAREALTALQEQST